MTNPFSALLYFFLRGTSKKDLPDPILLKQIEDELNAINLGNHEKAIKIYPSGHLKDDENAWFKKIDEQNKYAAMLDKDFEKLIAEKYNLTSSQMKITKDNLFIKSARNLRETKEWKDWNNNLKKK